MAKIKTIIEDRFPKTRFNNYYKAIFVLTQIAETTFNTLMPFMLGFYLCYTKSLWFLLLLVFNLLFNIRVITAGKKIEIKIMRGI